MGMIAYEDIFQVNGKRRGLPIYNKSIISNIVEG
jgi:hypothetical protein